MITLESGNKANVCHKLMDVRVAKNLLELIGHTPMVELHSCIPDGANVYAKLEGFNPGGSAKDRPALWMIEDAEKKGLLKPGGTIVEPTSGNTGVGLAIAASIKGYKCIFVTTDKVALEKINLLRAYGAEVVVCPVAVAPEDPRSYYSVAQRLSEETPNAYRPDQYSNMANPQAHYETTGPEIWEQTEGKITHYVVGVGTGGTISGAAKYFKEQNPELKIVAADPAGSVFSGGDGSPYLVEGVGEDFWPAAFDKDIVDQIIEVTDYESFDVARRVTRQAGLHIGGSGGTAVAAASKLAEQLLAEGQEHHIVVLIPDTGRGYLSKVFDDDWIRSQGFDLVERPQGETVESLINSKGRAISIVSEDDASAAEPFSVVSNGTNPITKAEIIGWTDQDAVKPLVCVGRFEAAERAIEHLDLGQPVGVLENGRLVSLLVP